MTAEPDPPPTHRKPPFLKRVRIRNFKSIKFCDVTLEPLTVLVGRNGSGKSNFVEALAFLRDVIDSGAGDAVREHGGSSRVLSKGASAESLSIEAEFTLPSAEGHDWWAKYRVVLSVPHKHAPKIMLETFECMNSASPFRLAFERVGDQVVERNGTEESHESAFVGDRTHLWWTDLQSAGFLSQRTRGIRTYNFLPNLIRQPQSMNREQMLDGTGRNLASVLASTKTDQPKLLDPISQYFSLITGGIELTEVIPLGEYETVGFRVPNSEQSAGIEFDAAGMSDGTLRVLAALTAAFQPGWPLDAPSLVAIEEPETSLHPAAMHALVDALNEATGRTQILLTTHSAELLDNPLIRTENVRVVEMVDGESVITSVDEGSAEIVRQQLDTLGGLERQAQLTRNLDDEDRQRALAAEGRPQ